MITELFRRARLANLQEHYSYGFGGNVTQVINVMRDWARYPFLPMPLVEQLSYIAPYITVPGLRARCWDLACA